MKTPASSAAAQLCDWGYRVVKTEKDHFLIQCGSSVFYLTADALRHVIKQEPVTVQSPHGRKTHRAIRIGRTYITPCGSRWPVAAAKPAAAPVSCTICRERLGNTPPSGSRVLEGIQRMSDEFVSLFCQKHAPTNTDLKRRTDVYKVIKYRNPVIDEYGEDGLEWHCDGYITVADRVEIPRGTSERQVIELFKRLAGFPPEQKLELIQDLAPDYLRFLDGQTGLPLGEMVNLSPSE